MNLTWTKKNIWKSIYLAVFALLFMVALFLFRQEGLFLDVNYEERFYWQISATESGRTFQRGDLLFAQEYYYPQSSVVYIRVSGDKIKAKSWCLDFDGDRLTVDDGEKSFSGHFQLSDRSATFFYDGKENFDFQFGTLSLSEDQDVATTNFLVNDLIRMAAGQSDQRNRYSLEAFLGWILLQLLAYILLFYQNKLFELKKLFEWDYRNAEALEPSGFYYFGNYVGAAVCWGMSVLLYLIAVAVIP